MNEWRELPNGDIEELEAKVIAQQARIEQLNATLNKFLDSHEECFDFDGFTAYVVSMDDFHDAKEAINTKPDNLSALRAHDDALENCRLFAARNRNEEWAKTILRFCSEAGITGSPFRADAIEKGGM